MKDPIPRIAAIDWLSPVEVIDVFVVVVSAAGVSGIAVEEEFVEDEVLLEVVVLSSFELEDEVSEELEDA